ncbi:MAG: hypothetical protein MUP13_11850, partial [Thermoanaerobaculales bacterium]|nr:hypothetical protein [Thermoanaerobaculales bacterium]
MQLRLLTTFGLLLVPCLSAADFTTQIEPILHERCYACHGPSQQMSGLRLDRRADALQGGYSGAVVIPGDAEASTLLARVRSDKDGFRMPPVGARLSDAQTDAIAEWIAAGAVWPERQETSAANGASTKHWSFEPISKDEPPAVKQQGWVRNPVDRFVLARLEAEGVIPSPEADR